MCLDCRVQRVSGDSRLGRYLHLVFTSAKYIVYVISSLGYRGENQLPAFKKALAQIQKQHHLTIYRDSKMNKATSYSGVMLTNET